MSSQLNKKRKRQELAEELSEDNTNKLKDKKKDNEERVEDIDEESEDSEEDSSDVDTDDTEDKEFLNKEIQIDFSAYQPIDEDFNGIKCLLSQLWLKEKINTSELTQLLMDQKHISSVLKQEVVDEEEEDNKEEDKSDDSEDDDVYGVTSVIPLAEYLQKDCIKEIRNTLTSYLPKDNPIHKLLINSSERIGLIINERFTNLPPKISLPSYQQLMNDLKTTKSDKQNKLNLEFEWFVMICKILKIKSKKSTESEPIYMNAEEEIFNELSDHSFEYSVAKQCDSDVFDWKDDNKLMEPFRRILCLSNDNWNKAINKLNEEFK